MAGGRWIRQNKVRPGAYINFKSKKKNDLFISERGIATMPLFLSWGPEQKVVQIEVEDNLADVLGIDILDKDALLIREAFKRAKTLLIYRLNLGKKAIGTLGGLNVTAKYSGSKGNAIMIIVQKNIDEPTLFEVTTLFEGTRVDKQVVSVIAELKANDYVEFKGTGDFELTAGFTLKDGEDGTINNGDYINYLNEIEMFEFNTMGIPAKDDSIKAIAANWIKRMREQEGKGLQVVLENYAEADYEGVISVKNGVILKDNTVITSDKAVAFVTGATAGAAINKSNTYTEYDGAIDVDIKYRDKDIRNALKNGEIVFTKSRGKIVIEQDINTLKSFTEEKNRDFRKNRILRTLDAINDDVTMLWEERYLGKGDNDEDGRNLYKKDIIQYLEKLQQMHALQNVVAEDIIVIQGAEKDAVVSTLGVEAVDAMEKLYMDVEVR